MAKSILSLAYVVMSRSGRFLLQDDSWGREEANDMCEAKVFLRRSRAEKELALRDASGSTFEIGVYNGKPVMLVDAYDYWLLARFRKKSS
jgi:hypothetical protein